MLSMHEALDSGHSSTKTNKDQAPGLLISWLLWPEAPGFPRHLGALPQGGRQTRPHKALA